jgi:hypothetical protein
MWLVVENLRHVVAQLVEARGGAIGWGTGLYSRKVAGLIPYGAIGIVH